MRDFLRRVGLPSIIDATPATLRPPVHMTPAARLLLLVGRPLWAWRVELATVLLDDPGATELLLAYAALGPQNRAATRDIVAGTRQLESASA